MRLTEFTYSDVELQKLSRAVASVLVNVSKDNMKTFELTGVTNGSADTALKFRHAMKQVPSFWFFLEGRIYVPFDGADENEIDIRSGQTSESFRILLVA